MYERQDWQSHIERTKSKKRKVRIYSRTVAEKKQHKRKQKPVEVDEVFATETEKPEIPLVPAIPPVSTQQPTRVIDDSTAPDEQNVVIPFNVRSSR
jgi:hypothetical protein